MAENHSTHQGASDDTGSCVAWETKRTARDFLNSPVAHICLILTLGLLVYANTFQVPFVFDDETSITQNHVIKNLHDFLFEGAGYRFNPRRFLGYLTLALNYHWGGLNVAGYHAFNLAVHLLTAVLFYSLVRLLFRTPVMKDDLPEGRAALIAALAALLFVAHPVQTQAVTYIVQRMASLAALLFVAASVCYLKGRLCVEASGRSWSGNSVAWFAGALLAALLAMRTKEIAFTLPLVVGLSELSFFPGGAKRKLLFLLPVLLCLVVVPLSFLGSERPIGELLSDVGAATRETADISRTDYLLTQFRVVATYLRLLILPVNQNLDYDYPVYSSLFTPPVFLSFLLLAALLALAVYLYGFKKNQSPVPSPQSCLIAFGIFWFFVTLSVESSVIPIRDVIFEHRLYLPSMGAFLAISTATFAAAKYRLFRPAPAAVLVLVLLFSFGTWQRNRVWRSEVSIWGDAVEKSPEKARTLTNYGFALLRAGRVDEAFEPLEKALALDASYAATYNHLGSALMKKNRLEESVDIFGRVIAMYPDYPEARRNLGVAFSRGGRMDEAVGALSEALRLDPYSAAAHFNLGLAYQKKGEWEKAAESYRSAVGLDPWYAPPYNNLGMAWMALGRKKEAARNFRKAVELDSENAGFARNLDLVLKRMGDAGGER